VLGNDADPDTGETSTLVVSAIRPDTTGSFTALTGGTAVVNGTYGTLTIHSDGTYSYTPNNAAAEALSQGTHADVFTYTAKDVQGATANTTLTFNVAGQNDAPVAVADTASISEDALPNTVNGNVLTNDTDVDTGDNHTVSAVTGGADNGTTITKVGTYGTLVITKATGGYTYTLGSGAQALEQNEQQFDVFTYTNSDNHGGSNSSTLTVTVTGVNDAPVAVADTAAVTEDSESNPVSGNVLSNDTDVDTNDSHSVTAVNGSSANVGQNVAGTYGTLHLNADGSYTYTLDNSKPSVQALADGQQVTDVFTYTNSDNHGGSNSATLTVTVTGADDSPTAEPVEVSVDTASDTNVMIILDVSGSMNSNAGLDEHPTWTRLRAAIESIKELLDQRRPWRRPGADREVLGRCLPGRRRLDDRRGGQGRTRRSRSDSRRQHKLRRGARQGDGYLRQPGQVERLRRAERVVFPLRRRAVVRT
jgi:VCBS repeat-containing protein